VAPKASHRVKFDRAKEHLNELNARLNVWRKEDANALFAEIDPTNANYQIVYFNNAEIPLERFSPLIGDAAQNFRASLDHLVFDLGLSYSGTLKKQERTDSKFPIVLSKEQFTTAKGKALSAVSPEACAVIEGLQPYNTDHPVIGSRGDYLWQLHKLAIADKHHSLSVVAAMIANWVMNPPNVVLDPNEVVFMIGPIPEGRAPVARLPRFPEARDGEVKMDVKGALSIAFKRAPFPQTGTTVTETLFNIGLYLDRVVFPPLEALL